MNNQLHVRKLSDAELLKTIKAKKQEESILTLEVLHLLCEVRRRNLFLQLGFSSLWEYATKELGYSSGSAYRRIESMKLLSDFPEYETKVQTGELPLSTLSQLQTFFKEHKKECASQNVPSNAGPSITPAASLKLSEKKELIEKACGKSTREVEKLLRKKAPEVAVKDREKTISANDTEIRFVADAELVRLLNRVKDLCGGKNAYPNYNTLLKLLAKEYLKKKDPLHRSTGNSAAGKESSDCFLKPSNSPTPKCLETKQSNIASKSLRLTTKCATAKKSCQPVSKSASRYIPAETKRRIYARAHGQCEYRGGDSNAATNNGDCTSTGRGTSIRSPSGRRCECRRNLEIDHIFPHALSGSNLIDNLQLLCRQHNAIRADAQLSHFVFVR